MMIVITDYIFLSLDKTSIALCFISIERPGSLLCLPKIDIKLWSLQIVLFDFCNGNNENPPLMDGNCQCLDIQLHKKYLDKKENSYTVNKLKWGKVKA